MEIFSEVAVIRRHERIIVWRQAVPPDREKSGLGAETAEVRIKEAIWLHLCREVFSSGNETLRLRRSIVDRLRLNPPEAAG